MSGARIEPGVQFFHHVVSTAVKLILSVSQYIGCIRFVTSLRTALCKAFCNKCLTKLSFLLSCFGDVGARIAAITWLPSVGPFVNITYWYIGLLLFFSRHSGLHSFLLQSSCSDIYVFFVLVCVELHRHSVDLKCALSEIQRGTSCRYAAQ